MTEERGIKSVDDLPEAVKRKLSEHDQEVYRKAYNTAMDDDNEPEESHKFALNKVNKQYGHEKEHKYEFFKRT